MVKPKIGFISPRSSLYFKDPEKTAFLKTLPGFHLHLDFWSGLGTALPILASLTGDDFDVFIVDENQEEIPFETPYSIAAVTAMTHQAVRSYEICDRFRKQGVYTVLGGIHPTVMAKEAAEHADTVFIGEAENTWPAFLDDFRRGNPKPFYSAADYPAPDLKSGLIPRYDLITGKNYPIVWINTERGCPYDCEFCSVTGLFGKKNRHKSVEHIIREIDYITSHFKRIYIGFTDNNMFLNRKHSKELALALQKKRIRWVAQSDISIGRDPELLKALFEAGCHVLFIGFESLNEQNLEAIYSTGRKLKKEFAGEYEKMVEVIQHSGIGILGSFIIGLDFDTPETFSHITDFIDRTSMLTAMINILTPLPGTRLRERLEREKRILETSWEYYTFRDVNFSHPAIRKEEFEEGLLEAYRRIFSEKRIKKTTAYFKEVYKKI